ncbi:MAG: DUF1573 domain-containing protein [Gloeobacteraceae cyanobacterium ES-bin-316]|nr:DUF1573 domain-containing protein [Ferruginibacter sp.]
MKKILFLSAFTCSSMLMYAQHEGHNHPVAKATTATTAVANPAAKPAEEALLLKETEHDFGKIPQGKPVTYVFEVSNTGKTALKIDNVQASCGCTTPEWDREKAIEPGTSAKITVGYNAAAEGPFTKPVTITYNGTQTKQLIIKGEVWKTPAASAPANAGVNDLKN